MSYEIQISKSASKQIKKLPSEIKGRENGYRIRVGDYRILYDNFDDVLLVSVVEVGHCNNIYKDKS